MKAAAHLGSDVIACDMHHAHGRIQVPYALVCKITSFIVHILNVSEEKKSKTGNIQTDRTNGLNSLRVDTRAVLLEINKL